MIVPSNQTISDASAGAVSNASSSLANMRSIDRGRISANTLTPYVAFVVPMMHVDIKGRSSWTQNRRTENWNVGGVPRRVATPRIMMHHREFQVGDRVRVAKSVIMYHTPMKKGSEYDVKGLEGAILTTSIDVDGVPISANRPIQVRLEGSKTFVAHFEADELEHLE